MHESMTLQTEKRILSPKEVERLIQENKIPQDYRSRCVDGRYEKTEDLAGIAKPGGDAGSLMAVLGSLVTLGVSLDSDTIPEVLNVVVDTVGGVHNFNFHTDTHHEAEGVACGCGHVAKARKDPEAYGLNIEAIKILDAKLTQLKAQGANEVVLRGEHQEGSVVVINSPDESMAPNNGTEQVFVYNKGADEEIYRKLAKGIALILNMTEDEVFGALTAAANRQLDATLVRLADGLEVYTA